MDPLLTSLNRPAPDTPAPALHGISEEEPPVSPSDMPSWVGMNSGDVTFRTIIDDVGEAAFRAQLVEELVDSAANNAAIAAKEMHRLIAEESRAAFDRIFGEGADKEEEAPIDLARRTRSDPPLLLSEISLPELPPVLPKPWQREPLWNTSFMINGTHPVVEYRCEDTRRQRVQQYFGSPMYLHYTPVAEDDAYHKFRVSLLYPLRYSCLYWFSTSSFELCDKGALAQAAFIQELAMEIADKHPKCKGSRFSIKFV